jgi:hypothetical protein
LGAGSATILETFTDEKCQFVELIPAFVEYFFNFPILEITLTLYTLNINFGKRFGLSSVNLF